MNQDTIFAANTWQDVYAATGIPPGTKIVIQVKGPSSATIFEGSTPISPSGWDGISCSPGEGAIIDQVGVTGCWIKSGAQIVCNVQVNTDD